MKIKLSSRDAQAKFRIVIGLQTSIDVNGDSNGSRPRRIATSYN